VHLVIVEPHDTTVSFEKEEKKKDASCVRTIALRLEKENGAKSCCLQDGDTEEGSKHCTNETDQVVEEGNDLHGTKTRKEREGKGQRFGFVFLLDDGKEMILTSAMMNEDEVTATTILSQVTQCVGVEC